MNCNDIKIEDAENLLSLTNIGICLYDKTGTLTNTNTILGGVIIGKSFYPMQNDDNSLRRNS
jgi:magnesium-transporting ATPase (P-type)